MRKAKEKYPRWRGLRDVYGGIVKFQRAWEICCCAGGKILKMSNQSDSTPFSCCWLGSEA